MDNLLQVPLTMCVSKATLAAGTTTTFSTTGATLYCIKGKAYSTNAASNAATPTTDAATGSAFNAIPIGSGSVYVFCYDGTSTTAATAIKVVQGTIEKLDGGATPKFVNAPQFPVIPDNLCPFGYLTVLLGGSTATTPAVATWTFGTNNLSSVTGVTYNFQDVMTLPARPQVA